mmetsp:Transcript_48664/g.129098  ORF Transcript_48664/g.129098 Transcript_48664/m.129098 type:complete len:224 (+) Transcript_48664:199-870(+)
MPKYTNCAPLHGLLSYSQMATHLCCPSRDTESITYSVPFKNSCTRTVWLDSPKTLAAPKILSKHSLASLTVLDMNTPSVPADFVGFSTHQGPAGSSSRTPSSETKFAASPRQTLHSCCLTARRPARRTHSPIRYLSRRAGLEAAPFVGNPGIASVSASKNSTPDSHPMRQAVMWYGRSRSCLAVSVGPPVLVMVSTNCRSLQLSGTMRSRASGKGADRQRMTL